MGHTRGHQPTAHHQQAAKAIFTVSAPPTGWVDRGSRRTLSDSARVERDSLGPRSRTPGLAVGDEHEHPARPRRSWAGRVDPQTHCAALDSVVPQTDRGSQYVSVRFTERLAEAGIAASVETVGDSYDNALAETINGLFKTELIKPPRSLAHRRRRGVRHRRMGRLVQPPSAVRVLRRHPPGRSREPLLRSQNSPAAGRALTKLSLRTRRRGSNHHLLQLRVRAEAGPSAIHLTDGALMEKSPCTPVVRGYGMAQSDNSFAGSSLPRRGVVNRRNHSEQRAMHCRGPLCRARESTMAARRVGDEVSSDPRVEVSTGIVARAAGMGGNAAPVARPGPQTPAPRRPGRILPINLTAPDGKIKLPPRQPATQPIDGDGRARGCRRPSSIQVAFPGLGSTDLGQVIPSWVEATPNRQTAATGEARTVKGVIARCHISGTDFPLHPWHSNYDWNYLVRPDAAHRNLLSAANMNDNGGLLECEWDTSHVPSYVWGQQEDRVWIVGRWIFDCGHPTASGYRTEIHPPKAVATIRYEAMTFDQGAGPVRAAVANLYIGRNDTYFTSRINDQDYEFDIQLPPRTDPTSTLRSRIRSMTGVPPVNPILTPLPSPKNARVIRVRVPLKGVRPEPAEYGLSIAVGWSDPNGADAAKIVTRTVHIDRIYMDANLDPWSRDEWHIYTCINGRWKVSGTLRGDSKALNHRETLTLHQLDRIRISVCGYEADAAHDMMGSHSGVNPLRVSAASSDAQAKSVAKDIRDTFLGGISNGIPDENDPISRMFMKHLPGDVGTFMVRPHNRDYRVKYSIV